jgi:putative DNA primase/helicase
MTIVAPAELASRPQWVAWKLQARPGEPKPTKLPYDARTGRLASTTDRATWATFEEAAAFCASHDWASGVGYVLSADDPYVGIDLDACRDPKTGRLEPWAKKIVHRLNSYTEISPSGTGLRIFVRGELPPHGRRKGHIEIYSQARFLTITGDHYLAAPDTIQDRHDELLAWHHEIFGDAPEARQNGQVTRSPVQLADADLLLKARAASNGAKFWALWNGDYSAYGSQSEADLALVSELAFWTGPDPSRIDQLFRSSGMMRDKWERQDYREHTIDKALSGRTDYYSQTSTSPQLRPTTHVVDAATGEVLYERRFRFLTAAELKYRPDPEFIIERVLQKNTLALIVGAQESYKSFLGLDMAMSVSDGDDWQGQPAQRGTVAYISAEGGSGIKLRIEAWETDHDQNVEHCYFLADQAPQFLDRGRGGDVEELLLALSDLPSRPSLIFVDTLARTMVGGDENSAQDMGLFIASAEQIRQATGATVVMIHHNNKEGAARGSTALLGAVHTIIECSRERNSEHVIVRCGKQKDTDHFDSMALTSSVVQLDGENRSSLVLRVRHRNNLLFKPVSKNATIALDALATLVDSNFSEWRDATTLSKSGFLRARAELLKGELVLQTADRYSLSDVGHMFRSNRVQTGSMNPMDLGSKKMAPLGGAIWTQDIDDDSQGSRVQIDEDALPWQ